MFTIFVLCPTQLGTTGPNSGYFRYFTDQNILTHHTAPHHTHGHKRRERKLWPINMSIQMNAANDVQTIGSCRLDTWPPNSYAPNRPLHFTIHIIHKVLAAVSVWSYEVPSCVYLYAICMYGWRWRVFKLSPPKIYSVSYIHSYTPESSSLIVCVCFIHVKFSVTNGNNNSTLLRPVMIYVTLTFGWLMINLIIARLIELWITTIIVVRRRRRRSCLWL